MSSSSGLKSRSILISGSANRSCSVDMLGVAHAFVRQLAGEILSAGGNLVVFANEEPTTEGGERLPLTFDWQSLEVLEALEAQGTQPSGTAASGLRAVVVIGHKILNRLSEPRRALLSRLSALRLVKTIFIEDDLYTGGNIADALTGHAEAMLCLGGGKGVSVQAHKMMEKQAPVLPLDLPLGAFNSDGEGSLGLLKKARREPARFFPRTPERFLGELLGLSLRPRGVDPSEVARRVVHLLSAEFEAARKHAPVDLLLLTALPVELEAVRTALGLPATDLPEKLSSGTNYWTTDVASKRGGRAYKVALGCIGAAGNPDASAATTEFVTGLQPRLVIMTGIAAGIRGLCKLGEVVLSERVVAYEPAAEVLEEGEPRQMLRPESYRLPHAILQDAVAYVSRREELTKRLWASLEAAGMRWPAAGAREEVSEGPSARLATIASGEKLLRNPERLRLLRGQQHGRIEVGEMEAAGVVAACWRSGADFLIIRGISDFGDPEKNDAFQQVAAMGAAIVAVDFIREALRLDGAGPAHSSSSS
ncbi:nucleoside phosphorylase [Archangium gephyra]|uniref:Phosphorylase n=1 Tax=Archangium gephyra TaxID=48 RepID=A0AAC8TBR0_9BACT|nr:hypothetical protein [Archangium gephyra]AKI98680.1 phosphorylase [Archangium gephyra]REG30608.1 nucleoside phosphorylase [Archangium gephyra]